MANEDREFSFSTRRFRFGEADVAFADGQSDIDTQTNAVVESGTIQPDYVPVVDNFESSLYEDQGKTLSSYYDGDLSGFDRQQNTVFAGSDALRCSGSDATLYTTADRLSKGVTYQVAYQPTSTGGSHFKFFYGGSPSWYSINFRHAGGGGSQEVNLLDAGSTLDTWNFGDNTYFDAWNRFEFTVASDDSITVDMYHSGSLVQTLSGSGSGRSTGGFAFESYNGQNPVYDELVEV